MEEVLRATLPAGRYYVGDISALCDVLETGDAGVPAAERAQQLMNVLGWYESEHDTIVSIQHETLALSMVSFGHASAFEPNAIKVNGESVNYRHSFGMVRDVHFELQSLKEDVLETLNEFGRFVEFKEAPEVVISKLRAHSRTRFHYSLRDPHEVIVDCRLKHAV
jgi:hypothetical protein